jgi:Flp pilus assembly protein TadD
MAWLLAWAAAGRAGEADDQYIEVYKAIRQADALNEAGQLKQAMDKYAEARAALQGFHKAFPDWNVIAVNYRLDYLAAKIGALSVKLSPPAESTPAQPKPATVPGGAAAAPSGPAPTPADWANQFNALKEQARQWQGEKGRLQMEKDQLLADKALLEQKLKEALAERPAAADPRELAKVEEKIAALQKENDLLSVSLQRAKGGYAEVPLPSPGTAPAPAAEAERVKQLERERDDLAKKLEAANQALAARKGKGPSAAETRGELNNLRAKLEALEAPKVPYTAEELALLKPSEPAPAKTVRKSVREIPAGLAAMVAQARSYFSTKQYDKAEALYLQILREDEKNVGALSDLAFIQIKLNRLDAAEKHLKEALAVAPDDPYTLMILGRLRMTQRNWEEAFQALSRAALSDPQNAEVQNDLGIVLSEKGQRGPAETAFRKAVLLQPGYADPHSNLALFYLTQQPPQVALARWHYKHALDAGLPHNPEIERLLGLQANKEKAAGR